MSEQNNNAKPISYKKLFGFFLPLAATPVMIGLTHSIINAALARLPYPEESIAVFTVVKSMVMIISAPTMMSLQLVVTYVEDCFSYKLIKRFVWIVGLILFASLLLPAYTPLGELILRNLIGLKTDHQIAFAYTALRIAAFLPLVQVLRNTQQGLAISLNRTRLLLPGIVLRIVSISIFLWYTVRTQMFTGIFAGNLSWVLGIGIEGLFITGYLIYSYNGIGQAVKQIPEQNKTKPVIREITGFFLPLGFMISLTAFVQPVIQSGIARGELPTTSLAAYGVSWGLVSMICGPLHLLHQISLNHTSGPEDNNWRSVFITSLLTGLAISLFILFISLSPVGCWLLKNIIGVSEEIALIARKVILAFSLFPLIRSFREIYWGLLMRRRRTGLIAVAKTVNIVVVILSIYLGIFYLSIQPAVFGALAFTIGEAVETFLIWYNGKQKSFFTGRFLNE